MTLAELKRKLIVGTRYEIIEHNFHPECNGQIRQVTKRGKTIMYSKSISDNTKWATCNNGLGAYLAFKSAENWEFHDDICEYYTIWKPSYSDKRERQLVFKFRLLEN